MNPALALAVSVISLLASPVFAQSTPSQAQQLAANARDRLERILSQPAALAHLGLGPQFSVTNVALSGRTDCEVPVIATPFVHGDFAHSRCQGPALNRGIAPSQCALVAAVPQSELGTLNLDLEIVRNPEARDIAGDDWPVIALCNRTGFVRAIGEFQMTLPGVSGASLSAHGSQISQVSLVRVDFPMPEYRRLNPSSASYETLKYGVWVSVFREGSAITTFARTDRSASTMRAGDYPARFMNFDDLVGQQILDAGTGGGQFVRDMREQGVNAIGLDIHLSPEQLQDPLFVQADMARTPFANESFDGVYSSWAVFFYEQRNPRLLTEVFTEMARILKPGGFIRFTPHTEMRILHRVIDSIPDLEITQIVRMSRGNAVEVRKR